MATGRGAAILRRLHWAMVVTVTIVRVVEMPIDQVIDVVAVWHRLVAALRAVQMILDVSAARMIRRADYRIAGIDGERMFVHVVAVRGVEVAVV